MSSDRSRREIKTRGNDAQRINALEQLKRARQGGQAAIVEQPSKTNESEEEEVDDEKDDYESDSNTYEDIKPSTKRKSSNTHQKDSKRLKKKSRHSDDDDEEQTKSSEPKRRAQVFAKPEDEEPTKMHDIKSMFAATKIQNLQKQEQNQKDESDKLLSDIMFELQKNKGKQTRPPQPTPAPPQPAKAQRKPTLISPPKQNKTTAAAAVPPDAPIVHQEKELDWGNDELFHAIESVFIPVHICLAVTWCGYLILAVMWIIYVWILDLTVTNLFVLGSLTGLIIGPLYAVSFAWINQKLNIVPLLLDVLFCGGDLGSLVLQKIGGFVMDHDPNHFPILITASVITSIILYILSSVIAFFHEQGLKNKQHSVVNDESLTRDKLNEEEQSMTNYLQSVNEKQ